MKKANVFTKQIISDIDVSLRTPDSWDFPSENIRVINIKGQGFVVTKIKGDEETFSLSDGFVILGACAHNGIAYIASYNPVTYQGEIGCYPSPRGYDIADFTGHVIVQPFTGFKREYQQLPNLRHGNNLWRLRSSLFNFKEVWDNGDMIDMFAQRDYDDSVNLFLADNNNPVRCINTGFNQDAELLCSELFLDHERYYDEATLDREIILIKLSEQLLNVDVTDILNGGQHKPGNYFFFFRYLTENFDKTPFYADVGPVQVGRGLTMLESDGDNDDGATYINKKIVFNFTHVDTIYKYLQIALIHYSGEPGSLSLNEVFLIDKYYPITSDTFSLTVFGNEKKIVFTLDDILRVPPKETIVKTHCVHNNRYWGANWKEEDIDYQALFDLVQEFGFSPFMVDIDDATREDYWNYATSGIPNIMAQYKDWENTLEHMSFMRGEIYPFGAVLLLDNGQFTDVIPIHAYDYYTNSPTAGNEKGLMRFPFYSPTVAWGSYMNKMDSIFNIRVVTAQFQTYLAAHPDLSSRIKGFFFVRGNRIPNTIYQGFLQNAYNGLVNNYPGHPTYLYNIYGQYHKTIYFNKANSIEDYEEDWNTPEEGASLFAPYFDGRCPIDVDIKERFNSDDAAIGGCDVTIEDTLIQSKKYYAVWSPSHLFEVSNNFSDGSQVYIKPLYRLTDINAFLTDSDVLRPRHYLFEIPVTLTGYISMVNAGSVAATMYNVFGGIFSAPGNFSSFFDDYYNDETQYAFAHIAEDPSPAMDMRIVANRGIRFSRYLGIHLNNQSESIDDNTMVNVCLFDSPESYWTAVYNSFNVFGTQYYKISDIYYLDSIPGLITLGKGDIFLQRTFFRHSRWQVIPGIWDEEHWGNIGGPIYKHGLVMSFVTEQTINTAMRTDVDWTTEVGSGTYTYYPRSLMQGVATGDVLQWGVFQEGDNYHFEALYVNPGYNVGVSERFYVGYNMDIPYYPSKKPTRVRYSIVHTPFSYVNNFGIFDIDAFQDYDFNKGPIHYIGVINQSLVTVQEDCINRHYTSDRAAEIDAAGGGIIIGSGSILAPQIDYLGSFGSQHQRSMIIGYRGLYGVDWKRKLIWRIFEQMSTLGNRYADAKTISDEKLISSWMESFLEEYSGSTDDDVIYNSDILNAIGDCPVKGDGILSLYESRYKEIQFVFSIGAARKTLIFSEKLDAFIGTKVIYPGYGFNLNDELFICPKSELAPYTSVMYRSGVGNNLNFFGTDYPAILSFIVNGYSEEENVSKFIKFFHSIDLFTNIQAFDSIKFESDYMTYELNPFQDPAKFWELPEYADQKWSVPIGKKQDTSLGKYDEGAEFKGTWMRVTLTFSGIDDIFIRMAETNLILSTL